MYGLNKLMNESVRLNRMSGNHRHDTSAAAYVTGNCHHD